WSGDERSRLRQCGHTVSKPRVRCYFRKRNASAEPRACLAETCVTQIANTVQAHQSPWNFLPPLHVRKQVCASRECHGLRSLARENARGFLSRLRCAEFE